MRNLASAALAASLLLSAAPMAGAADVIGVEPRPSTEGLTPPCDDAKVLGQVEDQFEYGAVNMLQSELTVEEFSDLQEKAFFPRADDASFERRYCQGRILLSDQRHHTLYYTVSYPLGLAAVGWKAEGCVLGLDRWAVYGANCSSLRRF